MGLLVRSIGWGPGNIGPVVKKAVGIFSDGSKLLAVFDKNQTGVTGDGGDNTGVPKIYLYRQVTDGGTITLVATINASLHAAQNRMTGSVAVGENDRVHVCYANSSGAIIYHQVTFGTWAVSAAQTAIAAPPASNRYTKIDIDVIGAGDEAVIAAWRHDVDASPSAAVVWAVRLTTGTWSALQTVTVHSSLATAGYSDVVSVSGNRTASDPVAPVNTFALAFPVKNSSGVDSGDRIIVFRMNTFDLSGLVALNHTTGMNKGVGNGWREYTLFNTGNDEWLIAGTISYSPWTGFVYKFSYNRTTHVKGPDIIPMSTSGDKGALTRSPDGVSWSAVSYAANRVLFFGKNASYLYSFVARLGSSSAVFDSPSRYWEERYRALNFVPPAQVWAGYTGNNDTSRHPVLVSYLDSGGNNAFRVELAEQKTASAPSNVQPAAAATVTTDRPTLYGEHEWPQATAQLRVRMVWRVATDASFTNNLRYIFLAENNVIFPDNTVFPDNAVVSQSAQIPELAELFQGTWYVSAASIDESERFGPWSPAQAFTVSHPPSGADLYPTNGKVFMFGGTGEVTFTWRFTDPSASDFMTAAQIVVKDNLSGATIVDSGKQPFSPFDLGAPNYAMILAIPSSAKDLELRWHLTLWDSDDVAGPASTGQVFVVTDNPAPTVTAPAEGAIVTTGIPVVSWTPGVGGVKAQTKFKVSITEAGALVYDTGWQLGSQNSFTVPVGKLRNTKNYTVTVSVQDNFGLIGTDSNAFSTAWTPPASPGSKSVYLANFAKYGYIWISQSPTGADADFMAYNLWRRRYGDTDWTLVTSWNDLSRMMWYRDYLIESNATYQYAVTQMVDRFGDILESLITDDEIYTVTPKSEGYWLIHPLLEESASIPLFNVTEEGFTEEYESETYNVIGRGRHVDYGDRLGYSGQLGVQLRDRQLTAGQEKINYLVNPSLKYRSPLDQNLPLGWTLGSGGSVGTLSSEYLADVSPSPIDVPEFFRMSASALGTTQNDFVQLTQRVYATAFPGGWTTGELLTLSAWFDLALSDLTDRRVGIGVYFMDASSVQIGGFIDTIFLPNATPTEAFPSTAVGSPDYASQANVVADRVKRFIRSSISVPANAHSVVVRIYFSGNSAGAAAARSLAFQGAQLERGSLSSFFDGDTLGAVWLGEPGLSTSYTNGYYTARQQLKDIEAMKNERSAIYMRNPFGDIWQVATGNISVSRVAGTGQTEVNDITIPYQEVAF